MINMVDHQIAILRLSSILMLMMFVSAVHASPCHSYGQDTSQINQEPVAVQSFSGNITAIQANVIQHQNTA